MASERSSSALPRGGGDGETSLEALALGKVAEAADAIAGAASAGEVVRAIHAVAALVFPVDSAAVAGTVEEPFSTQIIGFVSLSDDEREAWRHAFYHGPAFPTMSKILLGNVALKWLQKIQDAARNEVYDPFFIKGPPAEVIQALIPALSQKGDSKEDHRNFSSNIERLLILCLLDHKGVSQIVAEFTHSIKHDDDILNLDRTTFISRVAQLLASVPDKIRLGGSPALTSPYPFSPSWNIVNQLLVGAEAAGIDLAADKNANGHYAYEFLFVDITAAIGLCLEKMTKKELETTKDVLNSILQGVSCRLESPIDLIRKMASAIALTFSKIVDPQNPLFLDDNCCETVDWEFGVLSVKEIIAPSHGTVYKSKPKALSREKKAKAIKHDIPDGKAKIVEIKSLDHDHISDPAMNEKLEEKECDEESMNVDASSDSSLEPYDLSDDDTDLQKQFSHLSDLAAALRKPDDPDSVENALSSAEKLVRASPDELRHNSGDLVRALVHVRCSDVAMEGEEESAEEKRQRALVALLVTCPFESLDVLTKLLYSSSVDISQRILIIDVMTEAAQELAETKIEKTKQRHRYLISDTSSSWLVPSDSGPPGASPWREVSEPGTLLSWSHRYERDVPSRSGQVKSGKSRKWGLGKAKDLQEQWTKNKFPLYAAAFMLPVMQGYDKRSHGVDLLNRDFVVLGKLIYMLGICMKCMSMHPEASALAPALLDMIRSRDVSQHAEAYVRRSVLFAASCILISLHPSFVASSLIEGNHDISTGLEWIRTWALQVAEADPDTECSSMAMTCLRLHSEMALQTSRALEAVDNSKAGARSLPSKLDNIIIPFGNMMG
ncbi:hypothetical protein PR202_ga01895 [Eleusine coracana subsp. coracana]|uniref:Telomere length regulation protein conserved domain-containing protein n=1 Tax=Eleusine coracana subsp. coracana TaxID=191504 RepID=A0AAV5BIM3_ELECO|nr:hypothetical protein PR202_ga01208 [Eleusine coracana subsp. coracana]GJM86076.1 hypothetical protein PR202_ga01895 [Eleusine coracana subsp. coracana]